MQDNKKIIDFEDSRSLLMSFGNRFFNKICFILTLKNNVIFAILTLTKI